ncbi:cytochrome P450 family monooxygenase (macronuclear) [Tetrahymena thermophila SB210]|uniref:Cytochrome P450 family monooxygenase n=2 Tax=Tetrahymena thermophila TaxID=5911 RepID=I7LXH5_TETTS|nr:cytochrome P450 family monooxygenase [Tetrahymena thermophila SB210]ABY59989.1 cytochrome P450 monooxygenase CYP5013C2 [Tetrahymena thermophila]EAS04656.2 cytochrome P450 family monooxygenase [Tetrahymena thermophila SB210]|eukprot:XP_001024901.2 cytochrome P450 family monooxygenase [Tetrahymena thermophila SB210]
MIFELILIAVALFAYFKIAKPYFSYLKYRKYGKGFYYPILGEMIEQEQDLKQHADADYSVHHALDKDPDQKLFVTNLGTKVKLRLIEPEIIKDFFSKSQYYQKDQTFIQNITRFLKNGIVFSEGNTWKESRKLFSPAFHYEYIQKLTPLINDITDTIFNLAVKNQELKNFDPIAQIQEITGRVIIASFFGEVIEGEKFQGLTIIQCLSHIINTLGNQTYSIMYFLFGSKYFELGVTEEHRKFNKFIAEFNKYLLQKIDQQIEIMSNELQTKGYIQNPCILAQLISTHKIDEITRNQLFQDFKTFYIAGMDTTGHLLGMTIYYVSQNKDIYTKLQSEIDSNTDQSAHGLIKNLPYLNAVIKETLRYYGPGNILFDRIAIKDHELAGIPIKKGTIVTPYAMSMQRNSKYYQDPHKYNPSRWLEKQSSDLHPDANIPFSAGQRKCIGEQLALLEARIILNKFIKMFDFTCPQDYKLMMNYKFLSEPVNPLPLQLTLRKQ